MRVLPLYHVTLDTTNESITFVPRDVRCWGTIDDTLQLDSGPFCSSRILYAVGDLGFNYNNKRVCKFFNKSYLRIPLDDYDCRICLVSQWSGLCCQNLPTWVCNIPTRKCDIPMWDYDIPTLDGNVLTCDWNFTFRSVTVRNLLVLWHS